MSSETKLSGASRVRARVAAGDADDGVAGVTMFSNRGAMAASLEREGECRTDIGDPGWSGDVGGVRAARERRLDAAGDELLAALRPRSCASKTGAVASTVECATSARRASTAASTSWMSIKSRTPDGGAASGIAWRRPPSRLDERSRSRPPSGLPSPSWSRWRAGRDRLRLMASPQPLDWPRSRPCLSPSWSWSLSSSRRAGRDKIYFAGRNDDLHSCYCIQLSV